MRIEDAIKLAKAALKLLPRDTYAHQHLKSNIDKLKAGTHDRVWLLDASLDNSIPAEMVPIIKLGLVVSEHHRKIVEQLRREFGNEAVTNTIERLVGHECLRAAIAASRMGDIKLAKQSGMTLRHEWVMEGDCTEVCQRLNGQVQIAGAPFVDPMTSRSIEMPPVVVGCGCRLRVVTPTINNPGESLEEKRRRIQEKLNRL